jgi:transposase
MHQRGDRPVYLCATFSAWPRSILSQVSKSMTENAIPRPTQRIIGLDAHPDLFTGALLTGTHPANAAVLHYWDKQPIDSLAQWAQKHTRAEDLIVLEASGNSFEICSRLKTVQRQAIVLESGQTARLKEAYCSNDKRSAVRIAESWLTGKAKVVWQPDAQTLERRELWAAYRKSIKRNTQMRNRIKSFLSDHGVRLRKGSLLQPKTWDWIWATRSWSTLQRTLLESYRADFQQAHDQRAKLNLAILQQVFADPAILQLTQLDGIGHLTAFALAAAIGDINRFANQRKLVAYFGLNPSVEESGNSESPNTELARHGRKDVRSTLVQGAQAVLKMNRHPLKRWAVRLLARKSSRNEVVIAVARKMIVAVWYRLKGLWQPVLELPKSVQGKIHKMSNQLKELDGPQRTKLRREIERKLLEEGIYLLDPTKTFPI